MLRLKHALVLTIIMLFISNTANAQSKIAVMDFRAGTGVENVDGMSAVFSTYFTPQGYMLVERTQIDRVIDEQGFQRSALTQQQMVKIGQLLNIQKMVVGDIIVIGGQYEIDVRVVDVETSEVGHRDGETWAKGMTYRDAMRNLAERLVAKMNADTSAAAVTANSATNINSNTIVTLYDYLKVFPEDLGDFPSPPTNVIKAINNDVPYGYNDWRVPTMEEMALIKANKTKIAGIGNGEYMTSDGKSSGVLRLVTTGKTFAESEGLRIQQEAEQRRLAEDRRAREIEQRRLAEEQRLYYYRNNDCGVEIYEKDLIANQSCPSGWRIPTLAEMRCISKYKDKIGLSNQLYITSESRHESKHGNNGVISNSTHYYGFHPYGDNETVYAGITVINYTDGNISRHPFNNYETKDMLLRCVRSKPSVAEIKKVEEANVLLERKNDFILPSDIYINNRVVNEMIMSFPEMPQIQHTINSMTESLTKELDNIHVTYNNALNEYQANSNTWSQSVRQAREQEIQILAARHSTFTEQAQNKLQEEQNKLMAPLIKKAESTIRNIISTNNCAYVNTYSFNDIIMSFPEMPQIQHTINSMTELLVQKSNNMQVAYNNALNEYQANSNTWSQSVQEAKMREIQTLATRYSTFTEQAQNELQEEQNKLMAPLLARVKNIIEKVAKDNGFRYVFDLDQLNNANVSTLNMRDITPLVRQELGF